VRRSIAINAQRVRCMFEKSAFTLKERAMIVRAMLRFCCLVLLLLPNEAVAQKAATPATFRVSAEMVLVPVTVTDHNGKTIEGLRAEDFSVLDNQTPQQIVSFTSDDVPCSVGLVLDISGSMRTALSAAKDVAQAFFKTANPEDEFLLLTVSTQPAALSGFTNDIEALYKSIEFTRPAGKTALIDTVYLGLNRMREARRPRRVLLILSDGMDNYSRYSKNELMRVAVEADVQIYTIILDGIASGASSGAAPFRPAMIRKPGDRGEERQGIELLEALADKTGGLHFRVRKDVEAKEAATKAGQALRNEYVIAYQLPDSGTAGKWHRVRVKSNVPKVSVHARNGYYAP
jgi:Ca-activated chloride channel family protein